MQWVQYVARSAGHFANWFLAEAETGTVTRISPNHPVSPASADLAGAAIWIQKMAPQTSFNAIQIQITTCSGYQYNTSWIQPWQPLHHTNTCQMAPFLYTQVTTTAGWGIRKNQPIHPSQGISGHIYKTCSL
jgi:hypothetical protein